MLKKKVGDFMWRLSWWWDDHCEKVLVGIVVAILVVVVCLHAIEHERWLDFAKQHNCRVVSRTEGKWIIGTDGESYFEPGQTGYLCDDGVTYWR